MENNYGVWERKGYTVVEQEFDYDLHCFEVIKNGEVVATIYPDSVDDMKENIEALNNGEGVEDWEDGRGSSIDI